MNVRIGEPIKDPSTPEGESLSNLSGWLKVLVALPFGLLPCVLLWRLWPPLIDWTADGPDSAVEVILLFAAVFVLHELVHLAFLPSVAVRNCTVGFWPRRLLFYVSIPGELSRAQYLRSAVAPALLLSVAPFVLCRIVGYATPTIVWATLANLAGSFLDLFAVATVLAKTARTQRGTSPWSPRI